MNAALGRIILTVCFFFLASGCNSFFYYPLKEIVQVPTQFKLRYQELAIVTPDNERLQGWAILPRGAPKNIVVLQLHGNAENRSTHFVSAAWMAYHGVDVVTVDYRGYNGSTGVPSRDGLVVDSISAMKWLIKNYPQHRRYVLGQSLGGALAIVALVVGNLQDSFSGLIVESAFHSYHGIAQMKLSSSWLFWAFQWLPYLVLSHSSDPIDFASQIQIPTLAFYHRHDPVVPAESSKKLYETFSNEVIRVQVLEETGHANAFFDPNAGPQALALEFVGTKLRQSPSR